LSLIATYALVASWFVLRADARACGLASSLARSV
jgi:hypothetical protein